MLFGLVFGDIFGLDHVIEPLWFRPLDHPLEILFVPLLFGAGMILLGLLFNGVEALWRGQVRGWLLRDAAVLVMYSAMLSAPFVPEALWVATFAVIWFVLGQLFTTSIDRFSSFWRNLALLLHSIFSLTLNSLSFVRVGAFALAHAGLSAAMLALIAGVSSDILYILLLGVGNILTVILEGIVVFVQTTRLVLFEFALHFLRAEGRIFQPMTKPAQGVDTKRA